MLAPATALALAGFITAAAAHGDHSQTPLAGPHKSLWYNTLPGDGGTQVRIGPSIIFLSCPTNEVPGRFSILWDFHVWPTSILPVPSKRG